MSVLHCCDIHYTSFFFLNCFSKFKVMNHHTLHFSLCLFYVSPVYQPCFPYINLCGLILLVILCIFIYSVSFHYDSCVFSVVRHNRMCKGTLFMKFKSLHYLARKALKCSSVRFAKVMCELLGCINKSKTKLYKLAARFFCCAVHTVVEAL
jgi:hypothetical protein